MKPTDSIKLVSQLLDLPLLDKDDRWCGVVDDVDFEGVPGKDARLKALLVGPGAYKARMPGLLFWIVDKVAGNRIARVPVEEIESIASSVHLQCTAEKVGLHRTEDRVRTWIPRKAAL